MQRAGWLVIAAAFGCAGRSEEARVRSTAPEPRPTSAPVAHASATTLAAALAEDMAPERAMPWARTRPLVWTDFKGTPPKGGSEGARTAHGLYYAWSCRGSAFAYRVTAAFLPFRSWVKPAVLNNREENPRVLRHEQAHFDISELYARRIRQRFAGLPEPCAMKDGDLGALARQLVEEEKTIQRRYDDETNHSLVFSRQATWEANLVRQLAALGAYGQEDQ
jgi:hypothetical protein